jgi:hypothetical protein
MILPGAALVVTCKGANPVLGAFVIVQFPAYEAVIGVKMLRTGIPIPISTCESSRVRIVRGWEVEVGSDLADRMFRHRHRMGVFRTLHEGIFRFPAEIPEVESV